MQIEQKNRGKTNHLSVEQIENLKQEYYSGESAKSLIDKYSIDISPNNLYTTFPLIKTLNEYCRFCGSVMYFIPPPKTSQSRKEYFCTTCLHKESLVGCKCRQCLYEKTNEKAQKKAQEPINSKKNKEIKLSIREYPDAPLFSMLTIKELAYLGALLRTHLYCDYLLINLNNNSAQICAPTSEYRNSIVLKLLERNIIAPYRLRKNEDQKVLDRCICGELYDICISDTDRTKKEMISQLMYPSKVLPVAEEEAFELLREVHLYEAIEYMMLMIQDFNLHAFNVEQKYIILFSQILDEYSQGQLFNLIYTGVRNMAARARQLEHGCIPMGNYIYKSISDRYEKVRIDDWEIKNFNQEWGGQQTELSQLVGNRLLGIGESAFYQVL